MNKSVLRETPRARQAHRRRYLEEVAVDTLFRIPFEIEWRRRKKAIHDANLAFLRWLKRKSK